MPEPTATPDLHTFAHHWQDEADAAFLYRILSGAEADAKKKDLYLRLAEVEERHVTIWGDLLTRGGMPPGPFRPSGRARVLAFLGRSFGPKFLLPMLLAEEGREVKGYLAMHRADAGRRRGQERGAHARARERGPRDHARHDRRPRGRAVAPRRERRACCGTSCTGSMMGSPRTSVSSPA